MTQISLTLALSASIILAGCSSSSKKNIIETGNPNGRPSWVEGSKIKWFEGDQLFFRTLYTVRGDERVSGCYQLAKLEAKTTILREIAEDIRGQIDSAQQNLSENAETILNQSITSDFSGRVSGVQFQEQYHERYEVNGTERIDCYTLAQLKKSEYEQLRRSIIYKLVQIDPGLKQVLNKRQIDFFSEKKSE